MSDLPSDEIQAALYQFFEKTIEAQIEFMRQTGLTLAIKPIDQKSFTRNKPGPKERPYQERLSLVKLWLAAQRKGITQNEFCQYQYISVSTLKRDIKYFADRGELELI